MAIAPEEQPTWVRRALVLPYVQEGADLLRRLMPAQLADERRRGARLGRGARQVAIR